MGWPGTNFRDRVDAGCQLAGGLEHYRSAPDLLVLALPRGGVPVAAQVARALGAPLDVWFAHKIGAPDNPEFAIGSVAETGPPHLDEETIRRMRIPFAYIRDEAAAQQAAMARLAARYRGTRPPPVIAGRNIILIDDGVATGETAVAALIGLRSLAPARLVFATPVAAEDRVQRLAACADELVILQTPQALTAVGEFYDRFGQVSDEEVIALLSGVQHA
jgi:predicted phosphoribosyltransferase